MFITIGRWLQENAISFFKFVHRTGVTSPWRRAGMNTFSENGNDFVGRLLHEGGVSRRTFSAFPQTQTASTEVYVRSLEIHIGVLTHYTSGVRNGRLCQELHLHSSAWWADVCQFQFTTLGWLKLVLNNILKTGWCHN